MIKRIFSIFLLLGFVAMFFIIVNNIEETTTLTGVGKEYAERSGNQELGAQNIVTAIIVTYRGLDTLGEVAVLFIAATGIAVLLRRKEEKDPKKKIKKNKKRESSEILLTGSSLLAPMIIIFGIYIFLNGHLTPGGGFQGGAVIASAIMLLFLADPSYKINHTVFGWIESLSGFTYVLIGVLGLVMIGADNFLDSRLLPLGQFGAILSAGAIPVIYTLVGLKVGTELASILDNMKGELE
ncbi:MAG: Na(+)/H(+) antiporter subunit B [Candidatus Delongbacteria bacterium]|nr:Na(+)/H(+) antiporter subunit B [Candidatus Delongbacteria bacterium]